MCLKPFIKLIIPKKNISQQVYRANKQTEWCLVCFHVPRKEKKVPHTRCSRLVAHNLFILQPFRTAFLCKEPRRLTEDVDETEDGDRDGDAWPGAQTSLRDFLLVFPPSRLSCPYSSLVVAICIHTLRSKNKPAFHISYITPLLLACTDTHKGCYFGKKRTNPEPMEAFKASLSLSLPHESVSREDELFAPFSNSP